MSVNIVVKWADNTKDLAANLKQGTDAITATKASVDKLVQSLGGDKLITAAHRMVAAIGEIGGAEKLTNAERDRTNALLDKAIQKYTALGKEAPEAMRALELETRKVEDAQKKASSATDAWGSTLGTLKGVMGGLGLGLGVGAIVSFTKSLVSSALESAGALVDLANKTGLSTETIQRMQFVAKQSGTDMTVFADAAFKLGVNLQEGTAKAREGAQALGLDWQALRAASPDEQFAQVVQALEAMEDPQKRNAAAVALFGKAAKEILPAIVDGYTKVAKEATVAGDAQVRAADAAGDALDRAWTRITTGTIQAVGGYFLMRESVQALTEDERKFVLQTIQGEVTIENYTDALNRFAAAKKRGDINLPADKPAGGSSFTASLTAAEAGYRALTKAQQDELAAALQLHKSDDDIINGLNVTADVLVVAKKRFEEHTAAVGKSKAAHEAWLQSVAEVNSAGQDFHKTIEGIDGAVVEQAEHLLRAGVSAQTVAKYYGLTDTQVAALTSDIKAETEATKNLTDIREKWEAGTLKLNEAMLISNSTELITIKQYLELAAAMKMVEQSVPATVAGFVGTAGALENVGMKSTEISDLLVQLGLHTKTLGEVFHDTFAELPAIMERAFEGGGGAEGAAKALGARLADDLIKSYTDGLKKAGKPLTSKQSGAIDIGSAGAATIGGAAGGAGGALVGGVAASVAGPALVAAGMSAATVGGAVALGAATLGIGAAAVGAFVLIKHLTTVSQKEKDARAEFAKLQDQYGSLPATIAGVGQAYELMGKSGTEAQQDLQRALDATHKDAQAEAAALVPINAVLAAAAQKTKDVAGAVDKLTLAGQKFGGTVPDAFKDAINQLSTLKGLTDDQRKALSDLTADVEPDFDALTEKAKTYGITLAGLGSKFQQANIESRTKTIVADFTALTNAGGDANGILDGMSDEISTLISDARRFGSSVPESLRPLLESLLKAGLLVDENGKKLDDLSGISFEDTPLDKSIDALAQAIKDLTAALTGAGKAATDLGNVTIPVPTTPPDEGRPPMFAQGSGGFQDFGTGTLAVLHGREAVITEGQAIRGDTTVRTTPDARYAGASEVHVTFAISTIDASDFQTVVEQKVFPALVNQLRRGRGLTPMQDVLGIR
jgi:hypothetical protein